MIRIKTKIGLILFFCMLGLDVFYSSQVINLMEVVSAFIVMWGLLHKVERFMKWNRSDKYFIDLKKMKKNGHSQQKN